MPNTNSLKHRLLKLLCWLVLLLISACYSSHSQTSEREREVRAVWIATFFQLDFPRERSTSQVVLTEQWRQLVRQLKGLGMNTLYFQIRPSGDAFYASDLAPWSRFLTGQEGLPPENGADLLTAFIDIAHEEGMEFHAWMNPLRATPNLDTAALASAHILRKHPEWAFPYGNRYYLNPGLPGVRWHLLNVVEEVMVKYDVDGIHMDDYFYPYPSSGQSIPDSAAYALYGDAFFSVEDWRRANVNLLIQELSSLIKQRKPYVKFGISPFGVWRNQERDKKGSPTTNKLSSYDDLYADVLKWVDEGWIDYIVPQLYWEIGHPVSDYGVLVKWWASKVEGDRLIIGHAAHKVGTEMAEAWRFPEELPRQMQVSRAFSEVRGHAFFRARSLLGNGLGIADSLRRRFAAPVLLPELNTSLPLVRHETELKRPRPEKEGIRLCWNVRYKEKRPHYFGLYRFEGSQKEWKKNKGNLLHLTPFGKEDGRFCFVDKIDLEDKTFTYFLVSYDRFHRKTGVSKRWVVTMDKKRMRSRQ